MRMTTCCKYAINEKDSGALPGESGNCNEDPLKNPHLEREDFDGAASNSKTIYRKFRLQDLTLRLTVGIRRVLALILER